MYTVDLRLVTLICIIYLIFMNVCYWLIFQKAGQKGWTSLIPVWNFIVMLRVAKMHWAWIFMLILIIIPVWGIPLVFFFFLIFTGIRYAKNFGKNRFFALGLIFLSFIFYPILAFSKNIRYTKHRNYEKPLIEKIQGRKEI